MRKYLIPNEGNFYKANLHCHSTVSDGTKTPEELKEIYKAKGYSIIAFTDHDVLIPHPELADETFLPLNGYEMEISEQNDVPSHKKKTCHMCLVALDPDNVTQVCYHREKYLFGNSKGHCDEVKFDDTLPDYERVYSHECISDMMKKGRDAGFFVTYNHPSWSLENYNNYIGYDNMHAMEICNYSCYSIGYNDYNEKEYDDMLRAGKRIYCISTDDNHNRRDDSCGGYIQIKAEKLEYKTVTDALVAGHFYASEGPDILELWFEDGNIGIKTSPAARITLHTDSRRLKHATAKDGVPVTEALFPVEPDDDYVRITVMDENGRCANTNAYFPDELFD